MAKKPVCVASLQVTHEIMVLTERGAEVPPKSPGRSTLGPFKAAMDAGPIRVREEFKSAYCAACHHLHPDDAFRLNWGNSPCVPPKLKPGVYETTEGFSVMHEEAVSIFQDREIEGLAFKQLGRHPWYVAHCTATLQYHAEFLNLLRILDCRKCQRRFLSHQNKTMAIRCFDYLDLPENPLTIFTTELFMVSNMIRQKELFCQQELFFQRDVGRVLREEMRRRKIKLFSWAVY